MDEPSATSTSALFGVVYAVPSGRPIAGAVVRFFEVAPEQANRPVKEPDLILDAGIPIGSALTNEKGEFSLPYSPAGGETAIAFVLQGPETGAKTELLSWSSPPRKVGPGREAFVIGVDERPIAKRRLEESAKHIQRLRELEAERKATLDGSRPNKAKPRLANLRWRAAANRMQVGKGQDLASRLSQAELRKLNAEVIAATDGKHLGSDSKHRGAPRLRAGKPREEALRRNQGRLGLESETSFSSVYRLLDALRPDLQPLAAKRAQPTGGRRRGAALAPRNDGPSP